MIRPEDLRKVIKGEPFKPIRIALSDGRRVQVRHPDQVVVAERHLLVGLAKVERSKPMATPRNGDAIAQDWLIVNLVQITTIEPAEERNGKPKVRRVRRKGT
jgi:hypothetical protein